MTLIRHAVARREMARLATCNGERAKSSGAQQAGLFTALAARWNSIWYGGRRWEQIDFPGRFSATTARTSGAVRRDATGEADARTA
jgi:hypothetical protein